MTLEEVYARVQTIRRLADDDEAAHAEEDDLHQDVLRTIASGNVDLQESRALAAAALKTLEISFSRWCA